MLPPLIAGRRRKGFILLALNGVVQAGVALASAWLLGELLREPDQQTGIMAVAGLVAAGLCLVQLRYHEMGEAERLGQDYVLEVRLALLRATVRDDTPGGRQRHGIAMTRLTSDLLSVKNWVSLGVSRMLVATLSIGGGIGALWLWSPPLALWASLVLASVATLALLLAVPLFLNVKTARRYRGRLSARVGELILARDTLTQFDTINAEVKRVRRMSAHMASALSLRMSIVGAMQGLADLVLPLSAAVFLLASIADPSAPVTKPLGALVILAFVSQPLRDLLRVVDYRIAFRESCRHIKPVLTGRRRRSRTAGSSELGLKSPWWRLRMRKRIAPPVQAAPAKPELVIRTKHARAAAEAERQLQALRGIGRPPEEITASVTRLSDVIAERKKVETGPRAFGPRNVGTAVVIHAPVTQLAVATGTIQVVSVEEGWNAGAMRWLAGIDDHSDAAPVSVVTIDGEELPLKRAAERRRIFNLLSPELPLLRRTAKRNLTDMLAVVDRAELRRVRALCGLKDDEELKRIGRRKLSERGKGLSPGLDARLRLARAVLVSPVVLLIDDPVFLQDLSAARALEKCIAALDIAAIVRQGGDAAFASTPSLSPAPPSENGLEVA